MNVSVSASLSCCPDTSENSKSEELTDVFFNLPLILTHSTPTMSAVIPNPNKTMTPITAGVKGLRCPFPCTPELALLLEDGSPFTRTGARKLLEVVIELGGGRGGGVGRV